VNPQTSHFASEISESLLAECRKLQNVIKEKDQVIKEKQADNEELRQKATSLESKFLSLSKSEGMWTVHSASSSI
jgi:hypothetical protein